MKFKNICIVVLAMTVASCTTPPSGYDGVYEGKELDHIAFPLGGLGAGMICVEGTGALSNVSLFHEPDLFNEPATFSAICVKGYENGAKVLEGQVPDYKIFGRGQGGLGYGQTTWGMPRFEDCRFTGRFPFAEIDLGDKDIPLEVKVQAWSPFVPNDEDASSLPVACLEYSFTNTTSQRLETIYTFSTKNFLDRSQYSRGYIVNMKNGFVLNAEADPGRPYEEAHLAVYTDRPGTVVDGCWFRGGWFDPLTIEWNKVAAGVINNRPAESFTDGQYGASLSVPVSIEPGATETVRLNLVWYVPTSRVSHYDSEVNEGYTPSVYEPWYSHRFANLEETVAFWNENRESLKKRSELFSETFFGTTLPAEVIDAVGSNLSILKSPTVLRQHDGRLHCYEGTGDTWGSCPGTTTHVWNYAQAIPHLFPNLERTLRETEFFVAQDERGHQVFRVALPIRPTKHDFHAAADGQLGGITKVYRDWRISGNDNWLKAIFPKVRASLDYCIETWDPDHIGAMREPQHNTYDIEFWGANGMMMSFYASALDSYIAMAEYLGEECGRYRDLLDKCRRYMKDNLWDGEYFFQKVEWTGLHAGSPLEAQSYQSSYSPEALEILQKEGPKYQYGTGCLTDGVLGCWMSLTSGREDPLDRELVKSHLNSVYRYNFRSDMSDHSCTQRPGYGGRHDAGTLICSWPKGGKPSLPFVYSDEVWTGIEYQAASHLIFEGEVEKGLEMVRAVRSRYDGTVRNPYNEYECGNWYARALSSYSLLQALTGIRYDAVEKTLYIDPKIKGDFSSFLSTNFGYASVGIRGGKPFLEVKEGDIPVERTILSGQESGLEMN
ncbi:MAG: non-lysosomal glucosylceramidase [Bacteroidales bacterium]|nr:non-lysosomal glucosylceramidase [Bacteroidales bacterium]